MTRVEGLYETHLTVASLAVSIPFYRDIVGLELAQVFEDRMAFFWVAGKERGMLGLWQSGRAPMGLRLHLAFATSLDGVVGAAAHLKGYGVQALGFSNDPIEEPVVIGWMPALSQYFADPDGHSIEYIHILDAPADPGFGVGPYSAWLARGHTGATS